MALKRGNDLYMTKSESYYNRTEKIIPVVLPKYFEILLSRRKDLSATLWATKGNVLTSDYLIVLRTFCFTLGSCGDVLQSLLFSACATATRGGCDNYKWLTDINTIAEGHKSCLTPKGRESRSTAESWLSMRQTEHGCCANMTISQSPHSINSGHSEAGSALLHRRGCVPGAPFHHGHLST